MAHMGHAASKKKKQQHTKQNRNKNTPTREYGWREEHSKNRNTCYKKHDFFSYQVTINKTRLYKRSKQQDGLETERAKKQQQHRVEKNLYAAIRLKNRYSYDKIKNKITKDNPIK